MPNSPSASVSLRVLIDQYIPTDVEFEAFCLDHFPEVSRQFGCTQDHLQKVNLLLKSVNQAVLLDLLIRRHPAISDRVGIACTVPDNDSVSRQVSRKLLLTFMFGSLGAITLLFVLLTIYINLSAIWAVPQMTISSHASIVLPGPGGDLSPEEFAVAFEKMAIKTVGIENTEVVRRKYFDAELKSHMLHIAAIDKRTHKTICSMLIPAIAVKSWASSISIWHPFAREMAFELAREVASDSSQSADNFPTSGVAVTQDLVSSSSPRFDREPPIRRHGTRNTNLLSGYQAVSPVTLSSHEEDSPDMRPADLSYNTDIGTVRPRIVPAIIVKREKISGEDPRLPDVVKALRRCQVVEGSYKVCISESGFINSVNAIKEIPGADDQIIETIKQWRYKPQIVTTCFIQFLEFQINANDPVCPIISGQSNYHPSNGDQIKRLPEMEKRSNCDALIEEKWQTSSAHANGQKGKLVLRLELDHNGGIYSQQVLENHSPEVDRFVMELINSNPNCRFKPAIHRDGHAVAFVIERYLFTFN